MKPLTTKQLAAIREDASYQRWVQKTVTAVTKLTKQMTAPQPRGSKREGAK